MHSNFSMTNKRMSEYYSDVEKVKTMDEKNNKAKKLKNNSEKKPKFKSI